VPTQKGQHVIKRNMIQLNL